LGRVELGVFPFAGLGRVVSGTGTIEVVVVSGTVVVVVVAGGT